MGLQTPPTVPFLGISPPRRQSGAANPLLQVNPLKPPLQDPCWQAIDSVPNLLYAYPCQILDAGGSCLESVCVSIIV